MDKFERYDQANDAMIAAQSRFFDARCRFVITQLHGSTDDHSDATSELRFAGVAYEDAMHRLIAAVREIS